MQEGKPKRSRGRPRTTDPDTVLETAMVALWKSDAADVSLNTICGLAAISKPSLYRAFGSEDGLTRAALDLYSERVLSDVFAILESGKNLRETLGDLIEFATADPRMDRGCLFYKMRARRHCLRPATQARVEELEAAAGAAYTAFLLTRREAGELPDDLSIDAAAPYLAEQLALAINQRASGEDPRRVREMLVLALSVFRRER